jgi:hypothetical protein
MYRNPGSRSRMPAPSESSLQIPPSRTRRRIINEVPTQEDFVRFRSSEFSNQKQPQSLGIIVVVRFRVQSAAMPLNPLFSYHPRAYSARPSLSIMPGQTWRNNGHKGLMPVITLFVRILLGCLSVGRGVEVHAKCLWVARLLGLYCRHITLVQVSSQVNCTQGVQAWGPHSS